MSAQVVLSDDHRQLPEIDGGLPRLGPQRGDVS
jgi:hypothetical protein